MEILGVAPESINQSISSIFVSIKMKVYNYCIEAIIFRKKSAAGCLHPLDSRWASVERRMRAV